MVQLVDINQRLALRQYLDLNKSHVISYFAFDGRLPRRLASRELRNLAPSDSEAELSRKNWASREMNEWPKLGGGRGSLNVRFWVKATPDETSRFHQKQVLHAS